MTPEQIEKLERDVAGLLMLGLAPETADEFRRALALAKAAIPRGQVAEERRRVAGTLGQLAAQSGYMPGTDVETIARDAQDALASLAAQAQSAETYRTNWYDAEGKRNTLLVEVDRLKEAGTSLMRESNERLGRAERAETLVAELEGAREALAEVCNQQGAELAAAEERLRALRDAEARAKTHEREAAALKDALDMYRNAWRRELSDFYTPKRHEIDGLAVSTKAMSEKAREAETLRKNLADAQTDAANNAEEARALKERNTALEAERDEALARCARLSAAGQVLSEHVDKAPECEGDPDCGWHNGGPCKACKRATGWTLRDEFAKAAMQVIMDWNNRSGVTWTNDEAARRSYNMAAAMLKVRDAKP